LIERIHFVKRENQPPLLCGIKEECAGKEGKYTKT
jgi:hypothetical protein